jgi:biopolymer transport protein ExbD
MMTDLSLTPLVDTALTLLIIFMVTAPVMRHAVRVQLPKGSSEDAKNMQEELVVYVDKENKLFFNNNKISTVQLTKELSKIVDHQPKISLFIRADKNASWGTVLELFDSLRSIKGIGHVVLPTQKSV